MSNLKKGKGYEEFVETVYKAILEAEKRQGKIGSVCIERNKIITSKSGTPAEIDIYWENEVAGIKHSVAIECKNYNKNIDIPRVRDFARKIEHISGLKGLMVTKKGFSENAIKEASADNIDLLVIREQTDEDWDGYIKTINIRMHIQQPCQTTSISPRLNKEWALTNGYAEGSQLQLNVRNDCLIFEDKETEFKHSLLELENGDFFEEKGIGQHVWEKQFTDGWMVVGTEAYKLDCVNITYVKPATIQSEMHIDFEQYVLAIMEYINGGSNKFVVLKNGEKKEY
ncbi:MAG: restriction endonuclease [Proteobacteria bacterium]|nr:restriction endonuclease [Pseudomonadota bacterium]MDA1056358.1 restriction endonuclease [Pseudomonadota bacterium]